MNRYTSEPARPIRPRRSIDQMLEDSIRNNRLENERPQRPIRPRRSLEEMERDAILETERLKLEEQETLATIKKEIDDAKMKQKVSMDEQIQRGLQWLQGHVEKTTVASVNVAKLAIETYFVAEIFDEVEIITSKLSHRIKEESIKLEDQEEKLIVNEFIDNNQLNVFLEYIQDDTELVKIFEKLPTARTLIQYLDVKFKKADPKLSNYNAIANNKEIKFKKYSELLSVHVDRRDNQLKNKLLEYKHIFMDINEVLTDHEKKVLYDFEEYQEFDVNFNYQDIWIKNYDKLKLTKKIIIYSCEFTYPMQWLEKPVRTISIQSRPMIKQKGKDYYFERPKGRRFNNTWKTYFRQKSKPMKNEVTTVVDILAHFLLLNYVEIDYGN